MTTTLVLYDVVLKPNDWFATVSTVVQSKISNLDINSSGKFLALGVFHAVIHSFLEGYYWRWLEFEQLCQHMFQLRKVIISSVGFVAYQVVLLSVYFGEASPQQPSSDR